VGEPAPRLDGVRDDALRFARDARRLAARHRKRIGKAREEIERAAADVEAAAGGHDPELLSGALQRLDGLWDAHLGFTRAPLWKEYGRAVAGAVALALALRACVVEPYRVPSGSMAPTLLAGDQVVVSKIAYGVRIPFTHARLVAFAPPRRGDVVVFESPRERGRELVKRVVGLPGDVVEIRDQVLYVNGVPQPRTAAGEWSYDEQGDTTGGWWRDTCRRFREALATGPLPRPASELPADVEASWQAGAARGVATHDVLQCRRARLAAREGPFDVVQPGHVFVLGDNRDRASDSRTDGGWQVPVGHLRGRATAVWWSWGRGGVGPSKDGGLRIERLFKAVE
jgi:signal peptidase I